MHVDFSFGERNEGSTLIDKEMKVIFSLTLEQSDG